jgi:signal transduction histidine kinase/CHASE1-domain containing sensor protein
VAVLVVGLGVTWEASALLRDGADTQRTLIVDQRAELSRAAVDTEVRRHLSAVRALAGAMGAYEPLTLDKFMAATSALPMAALPGATSIGFVIAAPDDGVAAAQALWRQRGAPGLTFQPQGTGHEHLFSVFSRPLDGHPSTPQGTDISQSAEPTGALNESRRSGTPSVSDTYVLLRDRALPAARQQLSFVLTMPVYALPDAGATPPGQRSFLGWIIMGLRGGDFVGSTLHEATQGEVDAALYATNGGGDVVRVAAIDRLARPDLVRHMTIPVANRTWRLDISASSKTLPVPQDGTGAMIGGTAVTLLLTGLIWVLVTARVRADQKVAAATAESRRQVVLLNGILDGISDGVGVVDEHGRFLIHNPAAKAMLESDGIYLPDGTTPFPYQDLPLVRAAAGDSTDGVELIIRNAQWPDGVLLSVSGRPFNVDGQRGAIAVFHDITAARERENDLAAFAGIVAHDLKNPLTVIAAHAQMAGDSLIDEHVEYARESIRHVSAGVVRMRGLIDDLLAYTQARDAPLRAQPVDLTEVFTDVIEGRVSHLAARPDVYLGPLPHVAADPGMIRHVVDNLVGNAFKYVAPGRTPKIDISASTSPDGWVRVEVADRGIGIPDADKPHVFESFHRAHAGAEYGGTGLGLAICRRIVERHGGTISVADNPGGGSRFAFTLPLARAATPAPLDVGSPVAPVS